MTTQRAFQTDYEYHVGRNRVGTVARPGEEPIVDRGYAGGVLVPGDAVYFDTTANEKDFKRVDAANIGSTAGIVLYDEGTVASATGTVTYAEGDRIRIGVYGSFYAQSSEALEYGDILVWDTTNNDGWVKHTVVADFSNSIKNPGYCAEVAVADANLFIIRFFGFQK